eukprot:m.241016 g.241016  ORF g.241016 m.241016 type:complete len:201 (-) comp17217_c0_seq1:30-632(-)
METEKKRIVKLILVGDQSVGKTNLMMRFSEDKFFQSHAPTIGIDFKVKGREYDGEKVKVQIWDTAGQERFRSIATNYFRNIHGVVLVFDVTNRSSFDGVKKWIATVRHNCDHEYDLIVVGNKCDLADERVVTTEEAQKLVESNQYKYFETSAKDSTGVEEAFDCVARSVLARGGDHVQLNRDVINTSEQDSGQPDGGCSC